MMLNESDINEKIIAESRIFHYGSGTCPYRSVISCLRFLAKLFNIVLKSSYGIILS